MFAAFRFVGFLWALLWLAVVAMVAAVLWLVVRHG